MTDTLRAYIPLREWIMTTIAAALDRAYAKHGAEPWGRHEFYAILREEVDELWDAIKTDADSFNVVEEAIQVAAMCFRYLETGDRHRGALDGWIDDVQEAELRKADGPDRAAIDASRKEEP